MITEKIVLWEDKPEITLNSYLIENSDQYRQGEMRPAVLVCPGGAFRFHSDREGEPVALAYVAQGFHAFVLRYSVQTSFPQCLLDAAKAVQVIRENAQTWLVDPNKIVIEGMSAGGYLAIALPALAETDIFRTAEGLDLSMIKPNAAIAGYPSLDQKLFFDPPYGEEMTKERSRFCCDLNTMLYGEWPAPEELCSALNPLEHITSAMVPVFVWTTAGDRIVPPMNTIRLMEQLEKHRIPVEGHLFGWDSHALSLATLALKRGDTVNPHVAKWFELSVEWLIHTLHIWEPIL